MSAPQANDLASPSATSAGGVETAASQSSSQPKSFHQSGFSVNTGDSHKTPSPTITSLTADHITDSSNEVKKSPGSKKPSPSNQKFLSTLKNFNIDRSKYKHYGHQSSMNTQSLERIINESKDNINLKYERVISNENGSTDNKNESANNNKIIIDELISDILGLPEQVLHEDSVWPYNIETLNEILRYKVEQEKTKQESMKNELGATAVELLKMAKSMDISSDLIPILFISNSISIDHIISQIEKLKSEPSEVIDELSRKSKEMEPAIAKLSALITKQDMEASQPLPAQMASPISSSSSNKRKHSDTQLPSFSETAESIKSSSNIVSPLRSPNKSPTTGHRRVVSGSDATSRETKTSTSSPHMHPSQLPLPPTSIPQQQGSQQHSPIIAPQMAPQGMYPIYYTPNSSAVISTKEQNGGKTLGSPYSQKYQPVMYPPPPANQPYQPGYIAQPPQYQYFVPSPPANSGSYMVQAPPVVRMTPQQSQQKQQPVPSHQFQTPPESNSGIVFRPAEIHDESPYKKQKSSGKNTSINFMITTPKNPPARKYNNPSKEKQ
ncbi:hypothetical protein G9P44_006140 [Scheffersomyces stipitis]|nr:hypothetical protein G9P44_006140 [Scheffersomyces stipitis]